MQAAAHGGRFGVSVADQSLEHAAWQQAHVFGEEAEQALRQEVADLFRRVACSAQAFRRGGERLRGQFGDLPVRSGRAEALGGFEAAAQQFALRRVGQFGERDHMAFARCAVEMGVDLDAQPVAHDQQRRVLERQRVNHQLAHCVIERPAWRLVLPGKAVALEDVGNAPALAERHHALLEQIVVTAMRRADAQDGAQLEEVLLRALFLVERIGGAARAPL